MNSIYSLKELVNEQKSKQPVYLSNFNLESCLFKKTNISHSCQEQIVTSFTNIIGSILTRKILNYDYQLSNDQTFIVNICLSTESIEKFKLRSITYKAPFIFNHFSRDVYCIDDLCLGAIYLNHTINRKMEYCLADEGLEKKLVKRAINLFSTDNIFLRTLLKNVSWHSDNVPRFDSNKNLIYSSISLSNNLFLDEREEILSLGFVIFKYNLILKNCTLKKILYFLNKMPTTFNIENSIVQNIDEVKKAYIENDILNVEINNWKENFSNGNSNKS